MDGQQTFRNLATTVDFDSPVLSVDSTYGGGLIALGMQSGGVVFLNSKLSED